MLLLPLNGRHGGAGPTIFPNLKEHPEAKDDPNSPHWELLVFRIIGANLFSATTLGRTRQYCVNTRKCSATQALTLFVLTLPINLPTLNPTVPFSSFSEMQKEGNKVPKVAFLCPFWSPNKVVRELWREVYSQNYYPDVWFNWKGKPLILADPKLLAHSSQLASENCVPSTLDEGTSLTQKFL